MKQAAVAAGAVLLGGVLAVAGHRRWEPLDGPPVAHRPMGDLAAVLTAKRAEPATPMPDPCAGYQPVPALVWPGKSIAIGSDGRETSLFDCADGRELFSAPGTPRIEEGTLIVRDERLFITVDRRLYGHGDALYEHEPRMVENKYGRPRADWMQHLAGRYTIAPNPDAATAPLRELVLEEFGLFFTRHGPKAAPPYPAGSFRYGRWDFLDHNNAARIRLGDESTEANGTFVERNVLAVGDVTLHLRTPAMRFVWRHAAGAFVERSDEWEEVTPRGTRSWSEQRRTADYIELSDGGCTLRLTMTQCLARCGRAERWAVRGEGGWE